MRKASGSEGSNFPFSTELIELRETRTRSASSAWLHCLSARSTRIRFFIVAGTHSAPRQGPYRTQHLRSQLLHDDRKAYPNDEHSDRSGNLRIPRHRKIVPEADEKRLYRRY